MSFDRRIDKIISLFDELYPYDGLCFLVYDETKPYELLFATMLSAQCTDERVNMVTRNLFRKYDTIEKFASANVEEMENDIHSVGFYHTKARHVIEAANLLLSKHGGNVPSELTALTALPGVGRKTANIARGRLFGVPCVAVDTHVARVSRRLGLTANTDPDKIEQDLMSVLPESAWIKINVQAISHGRKICKAIKPLCPICPFASKDETAGLCPENFL